MSRYDAGSDDEFEPGSNGRVLRNKLGITNPEHIEAVESAALNREMVDSYDWAYMGMAFTSTLICEMHGLWLDGIYDFAGKYREVNIFKGDVPFCPAANIQAQMERLDREVFPQAICYPAEDTFLTIQEPVPRYLTMEEVASRVAVVHAELILVHPFREGNGRTARWVATLMVLSSGYAKPKYSLMTAPQREEYYAALRGGFLNDSKDLQALFVRWISDGQAQLPA